MSCHKKTEVNIIELATVNHLHPPRKEVLVFVCVPSIVQKNADATHERVRGYDFVDVIQEK